MPHTRLVLLLVSADEADRRLVANLLGDAVELHRAATTDAALDAIGEDWYEAILLASDRGASDALRRLAEDAPRIPVIELADRGGLDAVAAARAGGAADLLTRQSLTAEELMRALHYAVEHRRAVDRVEHDALHDGLTGLPNRTLFLDRLTWSLRRARRRGRRARCAILFLDLDRFKLVNDSLGHQAGDELLKGVARRLGDALRPGDTVARLSGDEFTILLEDIAGPRQASVIAERVQRMLAEPLPVAGRELVVTASIGIALASDHSRPEDLIRDADVAMYRAKGDGKARHAVFDAGLHREVRARLDLETDLRRAIAEERLELRFQPIVRTGTGEVVAFEALCRWEVTPDEFIAVAEESGLIVPLGRLVLREAARRAKEWDVPVTVNVTAGQLRDGLVDAVESALVAAGTPPQRLRLDVTEKAMDGDPEGTLRTLVELRDRLGVHPQLDDFGAGASSLRFLHRFPGEALKIDRSLVLAMLTDTASLEIVRAITGLARTLGMTVVAEGVETAEHLERLAALGCDYVQGFHIAAPLTAAEARDLLDGRLAAGALA